MHAEVARLRARAEAYRLAEMPMLVMAMEAKALNLELTHMAGNIPSCPSCDGRGTHTSRPPRPFTYDCSTCNGTGRDRRPILAALAKLGWTVNPGEN